MTSVTMNWFSFTVVLTVFSAAESTSGPMTSPYITVQPASPFVQEGHHVTLHCHAHHLHAIMTVTWLLNGRDVTRSGNDVKQLDIRSFSVSDQGVYQCDVRTRDGDILSLPTSLHLAGMVGWTGDDDDDVKTVTVYEGGSFIVDCPQVLSRPPAVWTFRHNDTRLNIDPMRHVTLFAGRLLVVNASLSDAGVYRCAAVNTVTDDVLVAPSTVNIHVLEPPSQSGVDMVLLSAARRDVDVTVGDTLTIECVASGWPVPTARWSRYGGQLPRRRHRQSSGVLIVERVELLDAGTYICEVSNESCVVFVHIRGGPVLLTSPRDLVDAAEGDSVTLDCVVRSVPPSSPWWTYNARPVRVDQSSSVSVSGDGSLTLSDIRYHQTGVYQCWATNVIDTVSATSIVRVTRRHVSDDNNLLSTGQRTQDVVNSTTQRPPRHASRQMSRLLRRRPQPRHRRRKHWTTTISTTTSPAATAAAGGGAGGDVDVSEMQDDDAVTAVELISLPAPTVDVLSDTSVRIHWALTDVTAVAGLEVLFYKVQYRRVGRDGRRRARGWETVDEDIPRNRHSVNVRHLRAGSRYRFRLVAVFSNNDNKHGPNSATVRLMSGRHRGGSPRIGPVIVEVYSTSLSSISLKWQYVAEKRVTIDGFIVAYRQYDRDTDTYTHQTVADADTRQFVIQQLDSDTTYSLMMYAFNAHGRSDSSNTVVMKTLADLNHDVSSTYKLMTSLPSVPRHETLSVSVSVTSRDVGSESDVRRVTSRREDEILYIVLGVVIAVIIVGVVIVLCVCVRHQHRQRLILAALQVKCKSSSATVTSSSPGNGNQSVTGSSRPLLSTRSTRVTDDVRSSSRCVPRSLCNIPSSSTTSETVADESRASSTSSGSGSSQPVSNLHDVCSRTQTGDGGASRRRHHHHDNGDVHQSPSTPHTLDASHRLLQPTMTSHQHDVMSRDVVGLRRVTRTSDVSDDVIPDVTCDIHSPCDGQQRPLVNSCDSSTATCATDSSKSSTHLPESSV